MSKDTPLSESDVRSSEGLAPLPGEFGIPDVDAARKFPVSRKGILALSLLVISMVAVSAIGIQRISASGRTTASEDHKHVRERPTSATTEPRKLEMLARPASSEATTTPFAVPAIAQHGEETPDPIGIRRGGAVQQVGKDAKGISPEDAPVLLVSVRPGAVAAHVPAQQPRAENPSTASVELDADPSDPLAATSRNLQIYQRQLQGLLENLTKSTELTASSSDGSQQPATTQGFQALAGAAAAAGPANGIFGGQLQGSSTPKVTARMLGDRSLTLPKGTAFTCALKTRIVSATSGLVGCQVQRNVFGEDGRVLLIERGSHIDGEYRITSVRPGAVRIPVLWTRIRTPLGVTVELDSPATGKLGESGIDGHVDNRWTERIGAAMLLSLIDDSVKLVIQSQSSDRQSDTIVLPSTTSNTSKLAEKVLDSTINIPPLIYQNQGGIVGIYVARDVDFSTVYGLVPTSGPSAAR